MLVNSASRPLAWFARASSFPRRSAQALASCHCSHSQQHHQQQPRRCFSQSSSNQQTPASVANSNSNSNRTTAAVLLSLGSAAALTGGYLLHDSQQSTPSSSSPASDRRSLVPTLPRPRFLSMAHCEKVPGAPPATAHISRLMLPDDANPAGNVHGGTILHMIDQAGWAAATKYYNANAEDGVVGVASLARIERVDFLQPMFIGEVSQLDAKVTYTSPHTIEVAVDVKAENVLTGKTRTTNKARAWYVVKEYTPHVEHTTSVLERNNTRDLYINAPVLPVPQLAFESEEQAAEGKQQYEQQCQDRLTRAEADATHPITDSQATLIHVILPSDCHSNGLAQAGTVMKLMDTAAGVTTVKHCRSNVVTASLEAVDFLRPVFNGDLIEIHAYPIFNSSRSMDIEVNVFSIDHLTSERRLATRSIFTFVALDEHHRPKPVPPVAITTQAQQVRWDVRQRKYEERKAARDALKAKMGARGKQAKGDGGEQEGMKKSQDEDKLDKKEDEVKKSESDGQDEVKKAKTLDSADVCECDKGKQEKA